MSTLEYRTAGESHGAAMLAIVEGLPSDLPIDVDALNAELRRRQGGYGRGGRMKIETDAADILTGIRAGKTIGSPLVLQVRNRDHRIDDAPVIHRPRPGHADFAGALKYQTDDCRNILERASARETAARVAAGGVAKQLLSAFGVEVVGYVVQIGAASAEIDEALNVDALRAARDGNEAYCPDDNAAEAMIAGIKQAKKDKDTLGGVVEVKVFGMPPGVGSCMRWQDRLDARLMGAVGSIQAFKGVEIGMGFGVAARPGSQVHDEMDYDAAQADTAALGFSRRTNRAGGLEGGMTNGMPIVVRGVMKPISTLLRGLDSVNLATLKAERSDYERSDICAVPAASVVAEHVVALEVARSMREKFGGDALSDMQASYEIYLSTLRNRMKESR